MHLVEDRSREMTARVEILTDSVIRVRLAEADRTAAVRERAHEVADHSSDGTEQYDRAVMQSAIDRPISSGESSWRQCTRATITSSCMGKPRAKSRFAPRARGPTGSAFTPL